MVGIAEEFEAVRKARPRDPADEISERVLFRIRMRDGGLPPNAKSDLAYAVMKDAFRLLMKAGFDPGQPRDEVGRRRMTADPKVGSSTSVKTPLCPSCGLGAFPTKKCTLPFSISCRNTARVG